MVSADLHAVFTEWLQRLLESKLPRSAFIVQIWILLTCPCCWADLCQCLWADTKQVLARAPVLLPRTMHWHYLAAKELLNDLISRQHSIRATVVCSWWVPVIHDICEQSFISPAQKIRLDFWCSLWCNPPALHGCWFLTCTCNIKPQLWDDLGRIKLQD